MKRTVRTCEQTQNADEQRDGQTDKADRQTNRYTDKRANRQTNKQTGKTRKEMKGKGREGDTGQTEEVKPVKMQPEGERVIVTEKGQREEEREGGVRPAPPFQRSPPRSQDQKHYVENNTWQNTTRTISKKKEAVPADMCTS